MVCAGLNVQPAVRVVIPGIEQVCEWWWHRDRQLGLLTFLGYWLADGYLDAQNGLVRIGSNEEVPVTWLESELLPRVFPRWWRRDSLTARGCAHGYVIRCPPLYSYLRPMAVGPLGYNPRVPSELRSYPHFTYDVEVAANEQQSASDECSAGRVSTCWTEDSMLAAMCGVGDEDDTELRCTPCGDNDLSSLKRWLGEQNVVDVYSKMSRQQAVALLDGFCRADGNGSRTQYDELSREPTGIWRCNHSSMPLIDHLMLVGQLAGAAIDLQLNDKAGHSRTIDDRTSAARVECWAVLFTFTPSTCGMPFQTRASRSTSGRVG